MGETPEPEPGESPADDLFWQRSDPPSIDGQCDRCGWRGQGLSRPLWWPSLCRLLRATVGLMPRG